MYIRFPTLVGFLLLVSGCSNVTFHSTAPAEVCQIEDYSISDLQSMKQAKFESLNAEAVNQLALGLLPCVGNPDPEIRDGLVYESLSVLLRNEKLTNATQINLTTSILKMLNGSDDKGGYLKPFAALDLSELARADRINPYLTDFQRAELVTGAVAYLTGITDYRGYDEKEGWRHGVAHASDLALQLVLNDQIIEPQLRALRGAIGAQISPSIGHAYIHGESERLARPILYMARRGTFTQQEWNDWFLTLADPTPFDAWRDIFKSEAGLAKLHNTKAFLNAVYVNASASQNENISMLAESALEALKQLP